MQSLYVEIGAKRSQAKYLFDSKTIRFEPLAYMRGDTFDNSLKLSI